MSEERSCPMTRRCLLDGCLGAGLAGVAGSIVYPLAAYLVPPETRDLPKGEAVAAQVGELAPNAWKIFKFGTRPGLLIHTASGEYRAFSAVCTHLNCTVQYRPEEQVILCACHRGLFDMTGKNVGGPPPRPLESYGVRVQGGDIIVSRKA